MGRMGGEQPARPGRAAPLRSAGLGGCLSSQRLSSASTRPSLAGRFLRQRRPEPLREGAGGLPGELGCLLGRFGGGSGGAFPLPPSAQVVGSGQQTKGDLVTNNGGHVERNFCS